MPEKSGIQTVFLADFWIPNQVENDICIVPFFIELRLLYLPHQMQKDESSLAFIFRTDS